MSKAADFEAKTISRDEELKALADAKKIIAEATGAALSQVSFLQLAGQSSSVNFQAVRFVSRSGQAPVLAKARAARLADGVSYPGQPGWQRPLRKD